MPLQGDLQTLPARELLGLLARRRASGQLSLSHDMVACRFHLTDGRVMLASSSEEQNLLGRLLVERGLVDELELARVIKARGKSARPRLGKALTEAGLISAKALTRVLAEKIERLLADTLGWAEGTFYFDENAPSRSQAAVVASVDLSALLGLPPGALGSESPGNDALVVSDADVIEETPLAAPPRGRASSPPPSALAGKRGSKSTRARRGGRDPAAA